jgi:hypothetical protein
MNKKSFLLKKSILNVLVEENGTTTLSITTFGTTILRITIRKCNSQHST